MSPTLTDRDLLEYYLDMKRMARLQDHCLRQVEIVRPGARQTKGVKT